MSFFLELKLTRIKEFYCYHVPWCKCIAWPCVPFNSAILSNIFRALKMTLCTLGSTKKSILGEHKAHWIRNLYWIMNQKGLRKGREKNLQVVEYKHPVRSWRAMQHGKGRWSSMAPRNMARTASTWPSSWLWARFREAWWGPPPCVLERGVEGSESCCPGPGWPLANRASRKSCHPMALRSRPLRPFASLRVLKNRSGSVDAAHACVTLRLCGRHLYMSFHRSAPRLRDEAVAADRGATGGVHATTAVAAASRAAVVVRGRFFFLSIR